MQIPGRRFSPNDKIYTDWVSRGGDNVILRADRVASPASGTCKVTIRVLTKNADENTDGAVVYSGASPASFEVAIGDNDVNELVIVSEAAAPKGLKQLVRLEIVCTGGTGEWIQVRIFPPIFFNSAS